jgi:hypothetical protein
MSALGALARLPIEDLAVDCTCDDSVVFFVGNNGSTAYINVGHVRDARDALAAISPAGDTGREAAPVACDCGFTANECEANHCHRKQIASAGLSPVPDGYSKLPVGAVCKCPKMWRDKNGGHWCCLPSPASPQPAPRIGREEIAKLVLTAIMGKADAYVYGTSYAMKHNEERAQKAADAILSLTASAPAGGWQDIATAPKGAPILALEDYQRENDEGEKYPKDYQVVTKINGKWSSFGIYLESFEPTHWQPLPQGPTDTARDAGSDVTRAERGGAA